MFSKTMFACAAAAALCFAASITTNASAARATGGLKSHHHVGKGGSLVRPRGGRTKCWEAECGGDTIPIDANYVVRGCQLTPRGQPLPPWCEGAAGVPRNKVRGFRR
jgi:hypothetical protein